MRFYPAENNEPAAAGPSRDDDAKAVLEGVPAFGLSACNRGVYLGQFGGLRRFGQRRPQSPRITLFVNLKRFVIGDAGDRSVVKRELEVGRVIEEVKRVQSRHR